MPALPWVEREAVVPDREYLAMASRLPLKGYLSIAGFMRDTMAIRRQLGEAEGLVGYALYAQLARKTFWTFSIWNDRKSLDAFATAEPHRGITERLRPRMDETSFAFFTIQGSRFPMSWDEMKAPVR